MNLERLSGAQLGRLVKSGELSPTEVIQYFANRIEKFNPKVNAFTYLYIEDALKEAKKLEASLAMEKYSWWALPFAGVPVGLKDFLPSKVGWKNSHGGVPSLVAVDDADSEFYRAARNLGAIAVGKTNAPAFGFSGACQNKMWGATRNPFDLDRTSGGSSGGTAAAVSAGLITLGEGGDAGGSIRIPSGWCNLFGFKPSVGTVPSYCRPDGWTATHPYCFNGSLTKTVEDSAIMLNEMARFDPRDPISLPINSRKNFVDLMHKPIQGMTIGFTYDFDMYPVDREVKKIVYNAARRLEEAGAVVDEVHFNFKHSLREIMFCWAWAISIDTALDLDGWKKVGINLTKEEVPEEFLWFNDHATRLSIKDMREFNEIRTDILDNFENVLGRYDAIISPTTICPPMNVSDNGRAISVDGHMLDPDLNFIEFGETPMANFVGYPAASIPAGITKAGHPIGMQVIGRKYQDEDIFAIAKTFEEIQPWDYLYEKSYDLD